VALGGEPGRDDSGLPPLNVQIPDDARELERDVIAYRREIRSRRRRARLRRVLRPFMSPATAVPLIAVFAALSMVAGVTLSVLTITPASAPTRPAATARAHPSSSASPTPSVSSSASARRTVAPKP
jgi:hypothetical protein